MQYIFFLLFLFACLPSAINRLVLKGYVDGTWFFFFSLSCLRKCPAKLDGKKTLEELTIKTSACGINYRQECSLPDRPKKKKERKEKKKNEIDGNTKLAQQTH
uniref:Putative secreted protein n=1 Tax=Ixodes ricinus TaxID=34613 RepID=A0A6B0UGZ4_IXORI